ncbi:hypothetical protein [Mycobacterium vicinigordonae]|uniref:Uncharacterized protein n=1 Tax=Mycobacterium vicinigordonae TaxID=1719132 RepID=A0A7D6HW59_9MYCO|nr:hypothetical protein [Mycobacterium vicinigordonae]QLL08852.1 hypothetical protein H0P51_08095 [Mycobacterium vicinigordonae]
MIAAKSYIRPRPQPSAPVPEPVYSQAEQRQRRRQWLPVRYGGAFRLDDEIAAIVHPLAAQVAQLPRPLAVRQRIEQISGATHEVVNTVVELLAEWSSHADQGARKRIERHVRQLAANPEAPAISDEQILAGSWAVVLVDYTVPLAADLARLLDRTAPRGQSTRRPSASETLEDALRLVDTAASDLARMIPKVDRYQHLPSIEEFNAATRARQDRERTQRALSKLRTNTTSTTGATAP